MDARELHLSPVVRSSTIRTSRARWRTGWTTIPCCLFPIYKTITDPDSDAEYHIVGWVGFTSRSFDANGNTGVVKGSFDKVIWEGIQSQSGNNLNYGTTTIELVE